MAEADDVFNSREEAERLARIFEQRYMAILRFTNAAVRRAFGLQRFRLHDTETNRYLVDAARRVVGITETTRLEIVEQLRVGQAMGFSNWQIAHGVPEADYPGIDGIYFNKWRGRADMIARTELQHAQNEASLNRYQATGMVDRVQIVDGDDWDVPCATRNGTIVPISAHPTLNHPHCTLGLVPVLTEGVA